MERDLTLNFLAPQHATKKWRFSYRYLFYALIFLLLLPTLHRHYFPKKVVISNSVEIKKNAQKQKIEESWDFIANFFNVLSHYSPDNVQIQSISMEQNHILLQGQISDSASLNNFIALLNAKIIHSNIDLTELSEKENIEFSLLISPKKDLALSSENEMADSPPPSSLVQQLLHTAQRNGLEVSLIKPKSNGLNWQLLGSYTNMIHFLSELPKNKLILNNFQIKPNNNQLQFDGELNVVNL